MDSHIKVGVALLVVNEDKEVLMARRKKLIGFNQYEFIGGHVEYKEDLASAVIRETEEESGLILSDVHQLIATSNVYENAHYVTVFYYALPHMWSGIIQNKEHHVRDGWKWISLEEVANNFKDTFECNNMIAKLCAEKIKRQGF